MLTKIILEDLDGNLVHEVESALVEDFDDPDDSYKPWNQVIIWNNRVFVSLNMPDCDAPHEYQRIFEERPVVAVVDGDKQALVEQIERMASARQ